jgi:hypothetical protein
LRFTLALPMNVPSFTAAIAAFAVTAAHADDTTPIRVHRTGHPNAEAYRDNIAVMVEGCRAALKLPPTPAALPTADALAKLVLFEQEELFNGPLWARYETQRDVAPDATAGCKLVTFVHRSVRIERGCEWRIRGNTALIGDQESFQSPKPALPPQIVREDAGSPQCSRKPRTRDYSGLKSEDAGQGVRCFWASDMLRASMSRIGMNTPPADPKAMDFCHYDKLPYYQVGGLSRPVTLKSRGEMRNERGTDLSTFFGGIRGAGLPVLTAFSDGTPIEPARFTQAGAQAFLSQPAKLPAP